MTNTDKLDELYDKAFNSPESKIKYKLWMFKNNFNLCDGNFNEFLKIYKIINTPIYMRESRQIVDCKYC